MLRSLTMVGVIALSCAGMAQPAEAQSRGSMGLSGNGFSFSVGRGFERPESPAFERREEFFEHHRFFNRHRFFGFGGFFYPYYTTTYPTYYPYAAGPPEGASANAAPAPTQVGDLPPCRETTEEGVVIMRGGACTRKKP